MSEELFTCPDCGQANFTKRGLAAHKGRKACQPQPAKAGTTSGAIEINVNWDGNGWVATSEQFPGVAGPCSQVRDAAVTLAHEALGHKCIVEYVSRGIYRAKSYGRKEA